jgi:hypothetical protein
MVTGLAVYTYILLKIVHSQYRNTVALGVLLKRTLREKDIFKEI